MPPVDLASTIIHGSALKLKNQASETRPVKSGQSTKQTSAFHFGADVALLLGTLRSQLPVPATRDRCLQSYLASTGCFAANGSNSRDLFPAANAFRRGLGFTYRRTSSPSGP